MVFQILADVIQFLKLEPINIDNFIFKLFYKGSFILFLLGSTLGSLYQHIVKPIKCAFKDIDSDLATDYCWIHGTSYIDKKLQGHFKCIVDMDGIDSEDDAPDITYYQVSVLHFELYPFTIPILILSVGFYCLAYPSCIIFDSKQNLACFGRWPNGRI